jgi:flagellar hook-basal body complex protein FliE
MADLNLNVQPIKIGPADALKGKSVTNDPRMPSFEDTLKGFIKDVNTLQKNADTSIQKMVSGEITDVHQVAVAVQEANTAFSMMMEIRNKMTEAYDNVLRMQI